jgi:hypothetical protein
MYTLGVAASPFSAKRANRTITDRMLGGLDER